MCEKLILILILVNQDSLNGFYFIMHIIQILEKICNFPSGTDELFNCPEKWVILYVLAFYLSSQIHETILSVIILEIKLLRHENYVLYFWVLNTCITERRTEETERLQFKLRTSEQLQTSSISIRKQRIGLCREWILSDWFNFPLDRMTVWSYKEKIRYYLYRVQKGFLFHLHASLSTY